MIPAPKPRAVRSDVLAARVLAAFKARLLCVAEGEAYSFGSSFVADASRANLVDLAIAFGVLKGFAPGGELEAEDIFRSLCDWAIESLGASSNRTASALAKSAKALYANSISTLSSLIEWQNFLDGFLLPQPERHNLSEDQRKLRHSIAFIFALDTELFRETMLISLGYKLDLAGKVEEREQHAYLIHYKYGYVNKVELGLDKDGDLPVASAKPINFSKRLLDFLSASLILAIVSPFFAIIALVQIFDDGPLFYGQRRIGFGGKEFRCWKFRTMIPNAEAALADILARIAAAREEWARYEKLRDDPRITRIGKFLRRTSLDELPQLFNVINGEMSLVGPRPMALHERDRWGAYFRLYKQVKPGVTGPWQIKHRTDSDYVTRIQCLEEYVNEWSVLNDVKYLIQTLKVPFAKTGAY